MSAETLRRHPAAWGATTLLRTYTLSTHERLEEARAVWSSITDATAIALRAGVGTVLLNHLLLAGLRDEAQVVFDQLEQSLTSEAEG